MNRQEALEKLENFYYWNYDDEEYDQETGRNHKQNLEDIIKYLKQPISIVDFLGWEEDVIYVDKDTNIMYKIQDDNLLEIIGQSLVIDSAYCFSKFSIEELRKFKKQSLKYNLILQSAYRKLFDLQDNEKYLTMNIQDRDVFHSKYSTDNSKYQAQFTLEEIEEIKKKYDIDLCIYEIVEVQE